MSGINSFFKAVINPTSLVQLAMGPAGWASIAAKALFSAIGQQIIQKLGEKLGLPQPIIDGAQAAFCAASGDKAGVRQNIREATQGLADQFKLSPVEQGQLERASQQDVDNAVNKLVSKFGKDPEAKSKEGTKSWIMAIAESLGEQADKLATNMQEMSSKLASDQGSLDKAQKANSKATTATGADGKEVTSGSLASDNIRFGAKSQEFSMFFGSANTVIKTIGEALASGARKQ